MNLQRRTIVCQVIAHFLSTKSQLIHIIVDNVCNPTEKGKTQSCP